MSESNDDENDDKKRRITWRKFELMGDNKVVTYPFFKQPYDEKDEQLLNEAVIRTPFNGVVHESVKKAWNIVAEELCKRTDKNGEKLFPFGISGKSASDRFKNIVNYMKGRMDNTPWRSGTDDEAVPPFIKLAENAVELFLSFKDVKKGDKEKLSADKKRERDEAEAIRKASIGSLTRDDLKALTSTSNCNSTAAKPAASQSKSSTPRGNFGDINETLKASADSFKDRRELKKAKFEARMKIKEKQQELESLKLSLEKERLEVEKADRASSREQDALDREANRKIQLEQAKTFGAMVQLVKQVGKRRRGQKHSDSSSSDEEDCSKKG